MEDRSSSPSPFFYRRRVLAVLSVVWVTAARAQARTNAFHSGLGAILVYLDTLIGLPLFSLFSVCVFVFLGSRKQGGNGRRELLHRPPVLLLRRSRSPRLARRFVYNMVLSSADAFSTLARIAGPPFRSCATLFSPLPILGKRGSSVLLPADPRSSPYHADC